MNENDPEGLHGWWNMFYHENEMREHVQSNSEPAMNAGQIERYFENVDMLAAAKLYNVNIVVCSARTGEEKQRTGNYDGFKWEVYNPFISNSVS